MPALPVGVLLEDYSADHSILSAYVLLKIVPVVLDAFDLRHLEFRQSVHNRSVEATVSTMSHASRTTTSDLEGALTVRVRMPSSDLKGVRFCSYPMNDTGFLQPLLDLAERKGWSCKRKRASMMALVSGDTYRRRKYRDSGSSRGGRDDDDDDAGPDEGEYATEGSRTTTMMIPRAPRKVRARKTKPGKMVVSIDELKDTKREAYNDAARYFDKHPEDWDKGQRIIEQAYEVRLPDGSYVPITCRKLEQFISICRSTDDQPVAQKLPSGEIQVSTVSNLYAQLIAKYHKEAFDNFQRGEVVEYKGVLITPCLMRFLSFYFQDSILECLEKYLKNGGMIGTEFAGLRDPSSSSASSVISSASSLRSISSASDSMMGCTSATAVATAGSGDTKGKKPRATRKVTAPRITAISMTVPAGVCISLDPWEHMYNKTDG